MKSRCAKFCNSTSKSKATKPTWHTAPSRPSGMHPERYSLILLDVMMGEMSGFQDGPAAPESAIPKRPRVPDDLLHREGLRGRHGGRAEHRSRRLYHQALLGPRSAGPRALRAAPHRTAGGARVRGRSRFEGAADGPRPQSLHAWTATALQLTKKEFEILALLLSNRGRIFSREEILRQRLERRGDRAGPHGRREHHAAAPQSRTSTEITS